MKELVSLESCDVIPHLAWTLTGVTAAWSMFWRNCVLLQKLLYFWWNDPCGTVLALCCDLLQHHCILFSTGHSTIPHFPPYSPVIFSLLLCCITATWYSIIRVAISYTTLSKLHLAGSMFQRLSTPHGSADGVASIKCSTAKIGRAKCWKWQAMFLFPLFCYSDSF